jgi:RimJ/RimL family protein N-acetyltransferase
MAKSKPIETERLVIEPFNEKYLTERYVDWLNDPEVIRFSEQRFRTHTLESCRAYMNSFEGTPNYFWAFVTRESNSEHIGNINAYVDTRNKVGDVGILIGEKNYWGKGYGLEVFMAIADYLFREDRIRKVTAGTVIANTGMVRIMERAGMQEDGRRIRQVVLDGQELDVVYAALFRDDWLK